MRLLQPVHEFYIAHNVGHAHILVISTLGVSAPALVSNFSQSELLGKCSGEYGGARNHLASADAEAIRHE
jgi:hypothetical protein